MLGLDSRHVIMIFLHIDQDNYLQINESLKIFFLGF